MPSLPLDTHHYRGFSAPSVMAVLGSITVPLRPHYGPETHLPEPHHRPRIGIPNKAPSGSRWMSALAWLRSFEGRVMWRSITFDLHKSSSNDGFCWWEHSPGPSHTAWDIDRARVTGHICVTHENYIPNHMGSLQRVPGNLIYSTSCFGQFLQKSS